MLIFSGALPLLFNGLYYLLATPSWNNIRLLAAYDLLFLVPAIILFSGVWRGSWFLDEERVVFQPRHGRPKSLDWPDVERVLWRTFPVLKGHGVTIRLLWVCFSFSEQREARAFVESKLSAAFDLKPVEPIKADPPVLLHLAELRTKLLVLAFVITPLTMVVLLIGMLFAPLRAMGTLFKILYVLYLVVICSAVILCALVIQHDVQRTRQRRKDLRRIHPAWPWRLRREAVTSCQMRKLSKLDLDDWSL